MSGFLHRVAAGAINAPLRLHPLLGSIFGGAPDELHAAVPQLAEATASLEQGEKRARFQHDPQFLRPSHDRQVETVVFRPYETFVPPSVGTSAAMAGAAPVTEIHTLTDASTRNAAGTSFQEVQRDDEHDVAPRRPRRSFLSEPMEGKRPQPHAQPAPQSPTSSDSPFAPRINHVDPLRAALQNEIEVRRSLRAPRQAGRDAGERATEDVHIHIGRVEVIAVPQSPQRPVSVPAQKALSLSKYLERHGGQVG